MQNKKINEIIALSLLKITIIMGILSNLFNLFNQKKTEGLKQKYPIAVYEAFYNLLKKDENVQTKGIFMKSSKGILQKLFNSANSKKELLSVLKRAETGTLNIDQEKGENVLFIANIFKKFMIKVPLFTDTEKEKLFKLGKENEIEPEKVEAILNEIDPDRLTKIKIVLDLFSKVIEERKKIIKKTKSLKIANLVGSFTDSLLFTFSVFEVNPTGDLDSKDWAIVGAPFNIVNFLIENSKTLIPETSISSAQITPSLSQATVNQQPAQITTTSVPTKNNQSGPNLLAKLANIFSKNNQNQNQGKKTSKDSREVRF